MKEDAGAVSVETVLDEIAKLKQLRALGLPETLFRNVPAKLVTHYRQRAGSEKARELRRHPPEVRYNLLAALCWQRQREITDILVELLIHIAHRVGVRAEEKVEIELMKYAKKRHDTEMEVEKQYVDTHGQSEVGFAFCYLPRFSLLPRLKNLKKQRLYLPQKGEPEKYANLQPILTRGQPTPNQFCGALRRTACNTTPIKLRVSWAKL